MKTTAIPQTYRIHLESVHKLKLLKATSGKTMSELLGLMIDREWAEKEDYISEVITSQKVNKCARRILEKLKIK